MATLARLPDWEAGPVRYPLSKKLSLTAALVGPIVILSVLVGVMGGGWSVGALASTGVWICFLLFAEWSSMQRVSMKGRGIKPLDDVRFERLVHGLAAAHGLETPELYVIDEGGPNALVLHMPRPRLAVTRSLIDNYTRTEMEAVAAHCLLHLESGHLVFSHLAAALGRSGSRFAPRVGYEDDIHTAALTRYPPGLASAIAKAKPAQGATSPFWFVAHDASHRHPTERVAALQDL